MTHVLTPTAVVMLMALPGVVPAHSGPEADRLAPDPAAWGAAVDRVAPDGFVYEELRRCAGCHEASKDAQGNTTHRNAMGLAGSPASPKLTGKGWLSGAHGRSPSSQAAASTYCAWCHAPSQPGVSDDIARSQPVETDRVGVSCIACHASEAVNERYGHYQANFRPGGDRESLIDFVPRDPSSGVETNAQCLFCHLRPHAYTVASHAEMVEAGSLRCIDCHMAVYNRLSSGVEERYHNLKVAANRDPASCRPCHELEPNEMAARCGELVPPQPSRVHAVPAFE